MLAKKSIALLLCLSLSAYPALATALYNPAGYSGGTGELTLSADREEFRQQLLDFMADLDDALTAALADPSIGPRLSASVGPSTIEVPFSVDVYNAIEYASDESLDQMYLALSKTPAIFAVPDVLREVLAELPDGQVATAAGAACQDEYTEFQKIVAKNDVVTALTRASNGLGLAVSISGTVAKVIAASVNICEVPFPIPLSSAGIIGFIITGALKVAQAAVDLANGLVGWEIVDSNLCINSCVGQGFTEHFAPDTNPSLVGKGCDNRDNNCAGGIDERTEDMVGPVITIDDSLSERCFRSEAQARAAKDVAVTAVDDCSAVVPDVRFDYVPQICRGFLSAIATDDAGNTTSAPQGSPVEMVIDAVDPDIRPATMNACYPTLAAARSAFAAAQIVDCTDVNATIDVTENACVADLELHATDECGNTSSIASTVRVDGTPPEVRIDELLIPTVDGLACFSSQAEAIAAVRNATRYSDNCTPRGGLNLDTAPSGTSCDLVLTSTVTAMDACGGVTSDVFHGRVDTEPPVVTCSVQEPVLWRADEKLQDVGFSYTVSDNCGPAPTVEVFVTSDEPTAFAFSVHGDKDEAPDAVVERDTAGRIQRILLRAQRKDNGDHDGRVYRIRLVATDRCGLSSQAECFVTVPEVLSQGSAKVINSGQRYDATVVN